MEVLLYILFVLYKVFLKRNYICHKSFSQCSMSGSYSNAFISTQVKIWNTYQK